MILRPSLVQKNQIIVMGCFDGVHRGHQNLLMYAKKRAQKKNKKVLVFLFFPRPGKYFGKCIGDIQNLNQRCQTIRKIGAIPYVIPFDGFLASMQAEIFLQKVLSLYEPDEVIMGENARFGSKKTGDYQLMAKYFLTSFYPLSKENGSFISSSHIRSCIQNGNLLLAYQLLGRPFTVQGIVQHGEKLGRKLGFPTINLFIDDYVQPPYGVYHGFVQVLKKKFSAVISFGIRPTIMKKTVAKAVLEAFLFNFDLEVYGNVVDIQIVDFLRPEEKFSSLELLKLQMMQDAELAFERNKIYVI